MFFCGYGQLKTGSPNIYLLLMYNQLSHSIAYF